MTESSRQTQIAAATAYEALHVPALFKQWAPPVLDAVGLAAGDRLLDVACGTGVLAREAAARLGTDGQVTGLDPDPGMLAVAQELAPGVVWQDGSAESLPFGDHSFDAVVSQFGLMFFVDRPRALREMRRVLRPGGRLAIAVWDALANAEAYPIEVALLERIAGEPAANALRAPFVLGDKQVLASLVDEAGFASVAVDTLVGRARFPSLRHMVEADLRGWLPVMGVTLDEALIQQILEEAEHALQAYVTADGQAVFDAPAHIVTAVRPAA